MIDQTLAQALQKEIPILTAQIRSLYADLIQEAAATKKSISIFLCCLSAMR